MKQKPYLKIWRKLLLYVSALASRKGGWCGIRLAFSARVTHPETWFLPPFSLPWNNGYLLVRVVSSFHYRRFARVVKCLTLPLFKNGILVHSPAVPWKSASVLTAFHVRLFVFRSCIFHLWIFGQKIKSIQGSFSARRMAFDMYMYMYIYIHMIYIYTV